VVGHEDRQQKEEDHHQTTVVEDQFFEHGLHRCLPPINPQRP
jgi:hypothetical protein